MARLRLDVDDETYDRLLSKALSERRPIHWQAEVMLRTALGLPFPAAFQAPPCQPTGVEPPTSTTSQLEGGVQSE
jgi:hypothetical protein